MHCGAMVEEYVAARSRLVDAAFCSSGGCRDIVNASGVPMEHGWSVGDAEITRNRVRKVPGIRLLKAKAEVETSDCLWFAPLRTSLSRSLVHSGMMSLCKGEEVGVLPAKAPITFTRPLRYLLHASEL